MEPFLQTVELCPNLEKLRVECTEWLGQVVEVLRDNAELLRGTSHLRSLSLERKINLKERLEMELHRKWDLESLMELVCVLPDLRSLEIPCLFPTEAKWVDDKKS